MLSHNLEYLIIWHLQVPRKLDLTEFYCINITRPYVPTFTKWYFHFCPSDQMFVYITALKVLTDAATILFTFRSS